MSFGHNAGTVILAQVPYILSRGMYRVLGEPGTYTRYVGLDKETNKQLIVKHIKTCGKRGAALKELRQVLPQLTDPQIRHLVYELRAETKIELEGWAKNARWFLVKNTDV